MEISCSGGRQRTSHVECHNPPHAGHLGAEKTRFRVAQTYFWPSISKDVAKYAKQCLDCQLHKVSQQAPAGLMGKREVGGPWLVVASDVMGSFPPSKSQYRYMLVFQDLFTKFVEIRPLRMATAQAISKAFDELIVFRWGCPKYLVTDNGAEFSNNMMSTRLKELGVIQTCIAPYHAQANPTERVNRTLKTMMSIFVKGDHRNWDIHLHEFAYAINTMVRSSTRLTPAFLDFGRNPRSIPNLRQQREKNDLVEIGDSKVWADRLKRLPTIYNLVQKHLQIANEKQSKHYNKNRRDFSFVIGDLIVRRNHVLSAAAQNFAAKLAPKFTGPCVVRKVLSPVVYELEDVESHRMSRVRISDLKPFVSCDTKTLQPSTDFNPSTSNNSEDDRKRKRKGSRKIHCPTVASPRSGGRYHPRQRAPHRPPSH